MTSWGSNFSTILLFETVHNCTLGLFPTQEVEQLLHHKAAQRDGPSVINLLIQLGEVKELTGDGMYTWPHARPAAEVGGRASRLSAAGHGCLFNLHLTEDDEESFM